MLFIEKVILSPSESMAVTVPIAETPSATEKVDNDVMLGVLSLMLLIVTVISWSAELVPSDAVTVNV